MKYLSKQITLKLNAQPCIGCGLCETVCPHGVFSVREQKAFIVDRNACIECGACARNCPIDAITVDRGVGCAQAIINGLLTGHETCCGERSCCCSTPKECRTQQKN